MPKLKPQTIAAQAAGAHGVETGAIVPPIDITSTYRRDADNQYRSGFCYGRADNATVRQTERVITALEGANHALLLGSGMAAAITAFLALARPAHIVAPQVMYWSLRNWLIKDAPSHGIETTFVDARDIAAISAAVRPGETKMVWIETPSNPLWGITDIAAAAAVAHGAGALLGVDSTVATPVLTRPLSLGADVVMHSATKYLNGHSDVVAGALVFAGASDFSAEAARLRGCHGAILGPFGAAQLMRGMRTLPLRVAHQCRSALAIAEHFAAHTAVGLVLYPGLRSHQGHGTAKAQMSGGFGGMVSMRIKGGEQNALAAAAGVKLWQRATSLGGVESLIEHRASVEGDNSPCPRDLLRLSVGIEAVDDLIEDLETALAGLD